MQKRNRFAAVLLAASLVVLSVANGHAVPAGPPQTVNYQGTLATTGKTPVTAALSMVFSIYAAGAGGAPLWTETQTVNVSKGAYSVLLGSVTPISLPFNAPYYLGVTVGTDSEMAPRLALTSSPYAFNVVNGAITDLGISSSAAIADGKLAQISMAGKVSGAALTGLDSTPSGAGALPVANGGTGATTEAGALANLLPSQGSNSGKYLTTDGSTVSWGSVSGGGGAATDSTAPVAGGSGAITAATSGANIVVSWAAATDDVTPQGNLEYTLVYSTVNNVDSVQNAEANGSAVGVPWASNVTSRSVSGLSVGTTYYFNVIAKDASQNKIVYVPASKAPSPSYIVLYAQGGTYNGNLGGRSGADALCDSSANKPAGFSNFAAFISVGASDTIAGRQAFSGLDTSKPIKSSGGSVLASNWTDLMDGTIQTTLAIAQVGILSSYWNSGSTASGGLGNTCNGWTTAADTGTGGPLVDWGGDATTASGWITTTVSDKSYCADLSDILCIAW